MCLMLYIATDRQLREQSREHVTVAPVDAALDAKLSSSFTRPQRRFVGAEGSCSCDFSSIVCEEPMDYFDGMFDHDEPEERARSVSCVRTLFGLVSEVLESGGTVELLPSWANDEALPARGRVELRVQDVVPEQFFFLERFLYVVRSA